MSFDLYKFFHLHTRCESQGRGSSVIPREDFGQMLISSLGTPSGLPRDSCLFNITSDIIGAARDLKAALPKLWCRKWISLVVRRCSYVHVNLSRNLCSRVYTMPHLSSVVPAPRVAAPTGHYLIKKWRIFVLEDFGEKFIRPKSSIGPMEVSFHLYTGLFSFVYMSLFICVQVFCVQIQVSYTRDLYTNEKRPEYKRKETCIQMKRDLCTNKKRPVYK